MGLFDGASTALALVSAEVLHELTHTLNFLRLLTQQEPLEAAEAARFAKRELERIQGLVNHLRMFKLPAPQSEAVLLSDAVGQVVESVRDLAAARQMGIETAIQADVRVRTDQRFFIPGLHALLLEVIDRLPASCVLRIITTTSDFESVQLDLAIAGMAPSKNTFSELNWWELWPLGTSSSRRIIAQKLLRHAGWTISELHDSPNTTLRLTAPTQRSMAR